jgi:hypothetical protein
MHKKPGHDDDDQATDSGPTSAATRRAQRPRYDDDQAADSATWWATTCPAHKQRREDENCVRQRLAEHNSHHMTTSQKLIQDLGRQRLQLK